MNKEKKKISNKRYEEKHKDKVDAYRKEYWIKNREKKLLIQKKWRDNNKEKIKETNKCYLVNNPEKRKQTEQNYIKKNKEKLREYSRKHYKDNAERERKRKKEYRKTDIWKTIICNVYHRRRAKMKNTDITTKWLLNLKIVTTHCEICGRKLKDNVHLDHITPLGIGGKHIKANVRYVHAKCNLSRPKNGSDIIQYKLLQ